MSSNDRSPRHPTAREGSTFIEAARRAQIIDNAIQTIAEVGYARASLAVIARRAGISKSVISYYFEGKDDLMHQVVTGVLEAGIATMQPAIDAESTGSGKLRAYVMSNVAYMRTHREGLMAVVAIFSANRGGGDTPLVSDEMATAGVRMMADIIRLGQKTGEFRQCSAWIAATAIRASLDAIPPYFAMDSGLDLDSWAAELLALFERGLAP